MTDTGRKKLSMPTYEALIRHSKRLDVRDPAQDLGIFHLDSSDGRQLLSKADKLQHDAERATDRGQYDRAIDCYTEAILNAILVRKNCIQQAMLFRGRSRVWCKQSKYKEALLDAEIVLNTLPAYPKAGLDAAEILVLQKMFQDAFLVVAEELSRGWPPEIRADYVKFLVEVAPKTDGGYKSLDDHLDKIGTQTWNLVISALVKKRDIDALGGLFSNPGTLHILRTFAASDVNLSDVIFGCLPSWKAWGESLVFTFLENGANYQTVCPQSKYPLHTALKIGLKTERFQLMKRLRKDTTAVAEPKNENGDGLLHIACRHKSPARSKAIEELLSLGVDATCRNAYGMMAHELLEHGDPDDILIRQHIDKTKESTSQKVSITSEVAISKPLPGSVITWSQADAKHWLGRQGLVHVSDNFHGFDGRMLKELNVVKHVAPEAFCRFLTKNLKLSALDQLTFVGALRSLDSGNVT